MGEIGVLVHIGNRGKKRRRNVFLDQLFDVGVEGRLPIHVVIDALMVHGGVVAEPDKRGAAFLARRLHETGSTQLLEVIEP